jgi:hypothetical protein
VTTWIIYRKGSFFLKERVENEALLQARRAILEESGAVYVGMVRDPEDNPWLRKAFELPRNYSQTSPVIPKSGRTQS